MFTGWATAPRQHTLDQDGQYCYKGPEYSVYSRGDVVREIWTTPNTTCLKGVHPPAILPIPHGWLDHADCAILALVWHAR